MTPINGRKKVSSSMRQLQRKGRRTMRWGEENGKKKNCTRSAGISADAVRVVVTMVGYTKDGDILLTFKITKSERVMTHDQERE
jgi:hypothetical protein